jgi:C-terminal processing protease CtpA/Prc
VGVLADEAEDVFDGIIIDTRSGPGGHRFADADAVAEIHEHGVVLKLDRRASESLPEPSANPAVMSDDPADPQRGEGGEIQDKLRRAWDFLSGNY